MSIHTAVPNRLLKLETIKFITVGPLADEILALCTLTRLKSIEISNHHDDALVAPLCMLLSCITSLETLALTLFDLDDNLVRHLAAQPNLKSLSMGRCNASPASLRQVRATRSPPGTVVRA